MKTSTRPTLPNVRQYTPYRPGPFRVGMDLHPLDMAEWIEIDERLPVDLAEKQRLLAERHDEVLAALPESLAGAQETLALLTAHLWATFPDVYDQRGPHLINRATGGEWDLRDNRLHPLELAARLVQEDFCVMSRDDKSGLYRLTGACVCFPSRWRLAEKLGKPINDIHVPVPTYAERLAGAMNRLFERLSVDKPVWRVNWSVVDDPALFQPRARPRPAGAPPITADNAGEQLWLRIERQTLRRLPISQNILFTIRIYNHPLAELANQPGRAAQLAGALQGLDEVMRRYKEMPPILQAALAWLERVAKTSP